MLDGIYRNLVKDLFQAYQSSPSGVKAMQFRAQHEDHLAELDELEESVYVDVDRSAQCYRVKLLALVELRDEDNQIAELLSQCRQLFDVLREAYRACPGCQLTLHQLIERTGLQAIQVRVALTYLTRTPVSCSHTGDLLGADDFAVIPGESYLRYKTFDAVIKQLREWEEASSFAKRPRRTVNEKVPKFRREMGQGFGSETQVIASWYDRLPSNIQDLMWEVHFAVNKELSALPSMGLRAVVDWVCNDKVGDVGGLSRKLNVLTEQGYITQNDKEIIENVIEVGHASVHRSHFPRPVELELVVRIIEHLLEGVYILGAASTSLRDSVPKRGEARF
jgi:hypothetical protein